MANIDWDAAGYSEHFSFVHQYGGDLLSLLDIRPGMRCLDLGCGNGALTERLKEAGLEVTGMDASENMLQIARSRHPGLTFIRGDATGFSLDHPVDIIFSNAVFHWIDAPKQPDLLACVFAALKPGGQLVFEFGGRGNNALIHRGLAAAFARRKLCYRMPFYFPSLAEYAGLLEQSGFIVTEARLFPRPTLLEGEKGLVEWMKMFVQAPFAGLDEALAEEIRQETAAALRPVLFREGRWYADYVRLRGKAIRP